MKTCPNCNIHYKDDFSFCEKCGTRLEMVTENPPVAEDTKADIANTSVNDDATPANPIQDAQPKVDPPYSVTAEDAAPIHSNTPSETPGITEKKKASARNIVIGVAAILVLIFVVSKIFGANPTYKLLNGLAKLAGMEKSTLVLDVNVKYDGDIDEAEILNDFTVKTEIAADSKNLQAETSIDMLFKNKSVVKVLGGIDNEIIYIDLFNLYNKKFYQEMDSLVPDYADYVNDIKIVLNAIRSAKLKFDYKKYANIVKDVLDDDIKGSGSKVTLTLNSKNMTKLAKKLLEEAADDEKLMNAVRTYAIDVLKRINKDKKKLETIDPDDIEYALETLEDKDDFEDAYINAIDEVFYDINNSLTRLGQDEIELTFVFGMFNKIKAVEYKFEIEDEYNDQTFNVNVRANIKEGARLTKINKKNAIQIADLITDFDEAEEVGEDIAKNLKKSLEKHKELNNALEDLGLDIEDALEDLLYGFSFRGFGGF